MGDVSHGPEWGRSYSSNPALGSAALKITDAVFFLKANLDQPTHQFWADEIGIAQAVQPFTSRLQGYRRLSDAYLLGLAIHKNAKFATTDKGVLHLLPEGSPERGRVSIVAGKFVAIELQVVLQMGLALKLNATQDLRRRLLSINYRPLGQGANFRKTAITGIF
jgi:hypothetical protein